MSARQHPRRTSRAQEDPVTSTIAPSTSSDILTSEPPASRRWLTAGVVAGVAGIGSIVASSMTGAVYEDDIAGDAVAITDRLAEMVPQILLFHTATMVSALLMVVFAAGLYRQLRRRLGATACSPRSPRPAWCSSSAALIMGSGLTTEFVFGVGEPGAAGARDRRLLRPLDRHHPLAVGRGRADRGWPWRSPRSGTALRPLDRLDQRRPGWPGPAVRGEPAAVHGRHGRARCG